MFLVCWGQISWSWFGFRGSPRTSALKTGTRAYQKCKFDQQDCLLIRPTTHECVHLVTRGHFRSCDKDGGHIILSAIAEHPMLHANFMPPCFIEPEFSQMKVLHCVNFRPFSCDPGLDPMIFI